MQRLVVLLTLLALSACSTATGPGGTPQLPAEHTRMEAEADRAANNFLAVVRRVEPVAEQECRARAPQANCDFRIVVDDRDGQPANAYQFVQRNGRPVIVFTLPMIAEADNQHELAFVMGHEAAHHILDHMAITLRNAEYGAYLMGTLAESYGAGAEAVQSAAMLGAEVGARSFSKEMELEADALGTVITAHAGYDPLIGARYFGKIPDPGDEFLGTHPPNAERFAIVRSVMAGLP